MNRTSFRKLLAPSVAVLALSISLTACGAGNESDADAGRTASSEAAGGLSGDLNGAGASSQEKAQGAWATGFQGMNDGNVTVNYDPVGSGDGRTNFIEGGVSFAGSDSYLTDDEGELSGAKERCGGQDPIEVPAYVSPIAVAFNARGRRLAQPRRRHDRADLRQQDHELERPGDRRPEPRRRPCRTWPSRPSTARTTRAPPRTSPTTSARPARSWSYEAEDAFPVKGGEAAEGTSGVVSAVTGGKGTIGYADESQVGDLSVVSVKVGEEYVAPSAEGAAKVVETSPAAEGRADVDMAVDIDRTTTESGAYPVVLLSYLIACQTYEDQAEADLVKGYLSYIVSDEGQQAASEEAGSAPLSSSVAEKAQSIVDAITAG